MKKVCTTEPLKTTNRVKICSYILYPQYEQKPVPVNNYLSQYQLLTSQFRSVLTKCRPYWIRTKRHVIKFSENESTESKLKRKMSFTRLLCIDNFALCTVLPLICVSVPIHVSTWRNCLLIPVVHWFVKIIILMVAYDKR